MTMIKDTLQKFRGMAALYVANGAAQALVSALAVMGLQRLLDGLAGGAGLDPVLGLIIWYGGFAALDHILCYVSEYPRNMLENGMLQHFKALAMEKVSRVDYGAWQGLGTGRLVQLVENGARAGTNMAFGFWLRIAAELLPAVVVNLAFVGAYNPAVMLAVAGGYAVVFAVSALLLKTLYRIKNRILANEEWLSRTFVRALMELVVFRVNRRFKKEIGRYRSVSAETVKARTAIRMVHELFFVLFALLVLAVKVAIVVIGAGQAGVTVGVIVALIAFVDKVYAPIAIFNVLFVDYKLDRVAFDRFRAFLELPDDHQLSGGEQPGLTGGAVSLRGVTVSFGGAPVLNGLDADIAAGSVTAIAGASGAGKSTLAKVLLGLVKPQAGRVLVDGQDLSAMDLDGYYRHVGYISQDAPVFDGTLRENIAFDRVVPDNELWAVLEQAQLAGLVRGLPAGLETEVGERGVKLSGGERQRLAFARVMLARPPLVVLDEPTSAMDAVTEGLVTQAFHGALSGSTVVVIAHRLNTIRDAGMILVLDGGVVAERGTRDELLELGGVYARLERAQNQETHPPT